METKCREGYSEMRQMRYKEKGIDEKCNKELHNLSFSLSVGRVINWKTLWEETSAHMAVKRQNWSQRYRM